MMLEAKCVKHKTTLLHGNKNRKIVSEEMLYLWIIFRINSRIFRINSRKSETGNKQISGTGENMQNYIPVKIWTKNRNTKRKLRPTAETILGQSQVWWSNCWVAKWCIVAAAAVAAVAGEDKLKTFEVGNWKNMQREDKWNLYNRDKSKLRMKSENCRKQTN